MYRAICRICSSRSLPLLNPARRSAAIRMRWSMTYSAVNVTLASSSAHQYPSRFCCDSRYPLPRWMASVMRDCMLGLITDCAVYPSKRSKGIWRSLRLRRWRRETLGGSAARGRSLIRVGQLALRVFQVIADDQRHILIEILDAPGNAIDSEIGAEGAARHGPQRRAFHPLPERFALAQVGLRAFIDA